MLYGVHVGRDGGGKLGASMDLPNITNVLLGIIGTFLGLRLMADKEGDRESIQKDAVVICRVGVTRVAMQAALLAQTVKPCSALSSK